MKDEKRKRPANTGAHVDSAQMHERPDELPQEAELVRVCYGVVSLLLPVAGSTTAQIRDRFASELGMRRDTPAYIEGRLAEDTTTVSAGQMLVFIRRAGEMCAKEPSDSDERQIDQPTTLERGMQP